MSSTTTKTTETPVVHLSTHDLSVLCDGKMLWVHDNYEVRHLLVPDDIIGGVEALVNGDYSHHDGYTIKA